MGEPPRGTYRAAGTPQGIRSATVLWWRALGPKSSCSPGPGQGRGESPRLGWRRPGSAALKSSAKAAAVRPLAAGAPGGLPDSGGAVRAALKRCVDSDQLRQAS